MSIEEKNVKSIYNKIAKEFSDTRYRPWSCVESFLDKIQSGCKLGDIGCGNGKNMKYRKDCENFGCDFSEELVSICKSDGLNVIYGDVLDIPFETDSFHYTIYVLQ